MAEASSIPNRMSIDGAAYVGGNASGEADTNAGKRNVSSLAQMVSKKLLDDVGSSITHDAQSGTFACGGSVPFISSADKSAETADVSSSESQAIEIPPVQLRFGADGKGSMASITAADVEEALQVWKTPLGFTN